MRRIRSRRSITPLIASLAVTVAGVCAASSASAQTWAQIVNVNSGRCVGVTAGVMQNNQPIIQWDCNNSPDQFWSEIPSDDGNWYQIQNYSNPGYCLSVADSNEGSQLVITPCSNGGWPTLWQANTLNNGTTAFTIENNDSYVAAVSQAMTGDGVGIIQWANQTQVGGFSHMEQAFTLGTAPPITLNWTVNFNDGTPVGGWVDVTINGDGSYDFSGHAHDSGWPDYNIQVACLAKDSNGTGYSFTASGFMHGTESIWLGGSRDWDFSNSGSSDVLKNNFAALTAAEANGNPIYCSVSVNSDVNSLLNQLGAATGVVGLVVGIAAL